MAPPAVALTRRLSRLGADIWLYGHGWALPIGLLILGVTIGLIAYLILPGMASVSALRAQQQALQSRPVSSAPSAPAPITGPAEPLRRVLEQADDIPVQVSHLSRLARQHGIDLPRGQYSTNRQTPAGIELTEITLNFVAGYPQARSFIEDLLRELPNAAVDRVSFERDQVQGAAAEVSLRVSLWRWPVAPKPEASR